MGKSAPKTPAAPDPKVTAEAQTASNKETALWNAVLNNVNQITPYGNLTYEQTGGGPQYNRQAYDSSLAAWNAQPASQNGGIPAGYTAVPGNSQYVTSNVSGSLVPISMLQSQNGNTSRGAMPKLEDFKISDGPPTFTSTVTLSPAQQQLLDLQNKGDLGTAQLGLDQLGRIRDSVSTPFSYTGLPSIDNLQSQAENALYQRLNPQFARDEEALRTRLINQGIGVGSEAYKNEMDQFGRNKNDALAQAVLAGQSYAQNARNQAIQEYTTQRNAPLNEYTALTSGQQIQNPQFSSGGYQGAQGVDYASMVQNQYQQKLAAANAQTASNNALTGALGSIGGSFLGNWAGSQAGGAAIASLFSDIRLKEAIEFDGMENGHRMYRFRYKGGKRTYRGVMAQDVEKIVPAAVMTMTNGYKVVNYDMLGLRMEMVNG